FTSDKPLLKAQLDSLKTGALNGTIGQSNQFDALLATLNELFNNEDIRPIVIFQTDGDQLESLNGNRPAVPFWLPRKYSFDDIMTAAEKARVTIYSVISGVKLAGVPENELPKRAQVDFENRQKANLRLLQARNVPMPNLGQQKMPPDFFSKY